MAASGAVATRLGLSGVPVAAETIALHTIFELVRDTGARVHLCRLSSAAGVELLRRAKAEGLPVTADVSINSLHLTDVDIGYFNAAMRLTPPLRQQRDRDALQAALADGTIDALVSDHTPVSSDEKTLPFGEATPGATGLELLLGLALHWGEQQPADAGADAGPHHLRPGARARAGHRLAGQQCRAPGRRRRRRCLRVRSGRALGRCAPMRWSARASTRRLPSRPAASSWPVACTPPWSPAAWPSSAAARARWRRCRASRVALAPGCCVLVHLVHGMAVMGLRFSSLDAAGRHARIQWWSATLLRRLGIALTVQGTPRAGATLLVANHVSWLDIAAIHAAAPRARFVSKSDVRHWPSGGPAGGRRGHAVHRTREQARRAARRAPDGRRAARRRHGGRVPGGHDRRRAANCCPFTPTCCRRRSRPRRRCNRWCCAFTSRVSRSARRPSSSARRRCCRACGAWPAHGACGSRCSCSTPSAPRMQTVARSRRTCARASASALAQAG